MFEVFHEHFLRLADELAFECVFNANVLQERDDATTDLSLYEEVKADRRSPRDTRDMHRGIVRNLRVRPRSAGVAGPLGQD